MKLWFVILTLAGEVGGTVGPVPYDIDECQHRVAEWTADAAEHHVELKFECRFATVRPENDIKP